MNDKSQEWALNLINAIEDEAEIWPDEAQAEVLWKAAYLLRQKYHLTVDDEN